jgi:hypothetical protein
MVEMSRGKSDARQQLSMFRQTIAEAGGGVGEQLTFFLIVFPPKTT